MIQRIEFRSQASVLPLSFLIKNGPSMESRSLNDGLSNSADVGRIDLSFGITMAQRVRLRRILIRTTDLDQELAL